MTDIELVQQLEERSRLDSERVVRLTGNVDGEPFELLIFRGFSSSTTPPPPQLLNKIDIGHQNPPATRP